MTLRVPEEMLRGGQRALDVVGDEPARVADHVGVALDEAEDAVRAEPRVHADDDRDLRAAARAASRSRDTRRRIRRA